MTTRTYRYDSEIHINAELLAALFPPSKQTVTTPCSRCGQGITSEVLDVRDDGNGTYNFTLDPTPTWDHYRNVHGDIIRGAATEA